MKKRIGELNREGERMVNVVNDLWYFIKDYATDADGYIVEVKADNGRWYKVSEVQSII